MYLLDFLNKNSDWEKRLRAKPYCLEIKHEGNFVLFKYNIIESDFNLQICKEARGSIFTKENGIWKCVCRSLDKFGNWGESYADTPRIDWTQPISIQEKVDGSIIRCWNYQGLWYISTNGTIDAFKAECGDSTYGDVFYSIIEKYTTVRNFFECLDPSYTYWFEMVHPFYNHIVVKYNEPAIYFLGRRKMTTMEEDVLCGDLVKMEWLKYPRHFIYNSLDEVLEACHKMGENEEGYVVCSYLRENGSYLRIKCKGDEYLKRHRLRGNGPITTVKIISLWQEDSIDDFIAYFPENIPLVDEIIHKVINLSEKAEIAYSVVKGTGPRKEFAWRAQSYIKPIQSYLFARLDNKVDNALTFFKNMRAKNLAELIDIKEIGYEDFK